MTDHDAASEPEGYQQGRLAALREVVAMLEQRAEWAKPHDARLAFLNAARGVAGLADASSTADGAE